MKDLVEAKINVVVFFFSDSGKRTWKHLWVEESKWRILKKRFEENNVYFVTRGKLWYG